jgi:hypothetical protein
MIHIRIDHEHENSKRRFACGLGPDLPAGDQYWFQGEDQAYRHADCPGCNPHGPRKLGTPISELSGQPGPGYERFKAIARSWVEEIDALSPATGAAPSGTMLHPMDFGHLAELADEAREALDKVPVPLPQHSADQFSALYYPLLLLTKQVEDTLTAATPDEPVPPGLIERAERRRQAVQAEMLARRGAPGAETTADDLLCDAAGIIANPTGADLSQQRVTWRERYVAYLDTALASATSEEVLEAAARAGFRGAYGHEPDTNSMKDDVGIGTVVEIIRAASVVLLAPLRAENARLQEELTSTEQVVALNHESIEIANGHIATLRQRLAEAEQLVSAEVAWLTDRALRLQIVNPAVSEEFMARARTLVLADATPPAPEGV